MVFIDDIIEKVSTILTWINGHPWLSAAVLAVLFLMFAGYEIRTSLRQRRRRFLGCPFCAVADGHPVTRVVRTWRDAIALEPLDPLVPGHLIVIPRWHVTDAADDPATTARVMHRAAQLIAERGGQYNMITSIGRDATQTVFHLHIHILPRHADDGLVLPWTGQLRSLGAVRVDPS